MQEKTQMRLMRTRQRISGGKRAKTGSVYNTGSKYGPRSQKHTLRQTELQLGFLKVSRAVDLVALYFRVFFNDLHGMPPPLITASVINRMK